MRPRKRAQVPAGGSIRRRLTTTLLALAVVPLAVAGVLLAWQTFHLQKAQALLLQQQVARRVADSISFGFTSIAQELTGLEADHGIHASDRASKRRLLEALQSRYQAFGELAYLDDRGREVVRVSRDEVLTDLDLRDRSGEPEFITPWRTGAAYFSSVAFDPLTGKPFLTLSSPVKNLRLGTVSGVISARIRLAPVWDDVIGERLKSGTVVYVLSPDGRVVAHPDPSVVLRDTRFPPPKADGFQVGLGGGSAGLAVQRVPVGGYELTVVAEQEFRKALALPFRVTAIVLALLLLVSAIGGVLGTLAVRQIVQPVEELAEVARAIQAGDETRQADASGHDEIADLANAFNRMTAQLQGTLKTLEVEVAQHRAAESARRQSEELLETVVNGAPIVLWAIDRDGVFTLSQGRGLVPLGLKPGQVVGQSVFDVYAGHETILRNTRTALGGQSLNAEWQVGGVWFDARYVACCDEDGRAAGAIGVALDITERKRMEEELTQHRERLEELVLERTRALESAQEELVKSERLAVLGQLTATVSHELRNPLGVIRSSAFYLKRKLPGAGETVDKHLLRIEEQVRICDAIVADLLEYTRGRHYARSVADLNAWLRTILSEFEAPAQTEVTAELAPGPCCVAFEEEKLRRIVLNLLSNAVQAVQARPRAPDAGGAPYQPRVVVRTQLRDGNRVSFSVLDNGVGMDESTRKRAFEPLFTTKARGTGLGLAIVEKIVAEHGGEVLLESTAGKGTGVTILLPAAEPPCEAPGEPAGA